MVLIVKNKNEIPYGVLSNGYNDFVRIDDQKWNSVVDFTTGHLGTVSEPYDDNFINLWAHWEKTKINQAIYKGIDAKSISDPEFEGLLLSSEGKPIIYVSEDRYLGVTDFSGTVGENVYGKWLTNYRNKLNEDSSEMFYNAYVLDRLLKTAINYESLENYLNMARQGTGIRRLIGILSAKYGKMIDIPSREIIEETRAFTRKEFLSKPEDIILNVMKSKIRFVRASNLQRYKFEIFHKFVRNVIRKYNLTYDASKFIQKMDANERNYSINRVYEGYTREVINGDIKIEDPKMYVPSESDIERIESMTPVGYDTTIVSTKNYAIVDSKTSRLSLRDDRYVFTVDNKTFPSISHYIMYNIGTLIPDFESYNMVYNPDTKTFYTHDDTKRYLDENIAKFKSTYFDSRLVHGIKTRISQHPYILDYLKSAGDDNFVDIRDFKSKLTNRVYNEIKNNTSWEEIMRDKGSVIDYVNTDSFFVFTQMEMFESFMNILTIATPGDMTHANVLKVYEQFFGNLNGVSSSESNFDVDHSDIKAMAASMGVKLSESSYEFLKMKFVERILIAEKLAHDEFRTDVIYMTKFLILESRNRIFNGAFINPDMHYRHNLAKYYLAMAKILNAIAVCNDFKVLKNEHVNRAFTILNSNPHSLYINNRPVEDKPTPAKLKNAYNELRDVKINVGDEGVMEDIINLDEEPNDEEDDENEEITGYDEYENDDDNFDDLMYAPPKFINDAVEYAEYIIKNLHPSKPVYDYIKNKTIDLVNSPTKNIYRVNLWQ